MSLTQVAPTIIKPVTKEPVIDTVLTTYGETTDEAALNNWLLINRVWNNRGMWVNTAYFNI